MTASVLHLLESLETRLERTKAELEALREENAQLKQQLAAQQRAASDKSDESAQRHAASFHSHGGEHSPGHDGDGHERNGYEENSVVTPEVSHQEPYQTEPEAAVPQVTEPPVAAPQAAVPQVDAAQSVVAQTAVPQTDVLQTDVLQTDVLQTEALQTEALQTDALQTDALQTQGPQAPVSQAPSPQALLKQWYQRYPKAFFKGHTKPLKVGIHHDLAQSEPWSGKLIRRALANYVNLPRYVKSMREGAERVDLDGNPAGKVDKEAALHARERRKERPATEVSNATQNPVATQGNAARIKSAASSSSQGEGIQGESNQGESNRNSRTNHAEVRGTARAEIKTSHIAKSSQAKSHSLGEGLGDDVESSSGNSLRDGLGRSSDGFERRSDGLGNSLEEKLKVLQQKFKAH
nr:ProQ/FINO family protein [Halomonas sp.]